MIRVDRWFRVVIHGEGHDLTLGDARELVRQLNVAINGGADPQLAETFARMAPSYVAAMASNGPQVQSEPEDAPARNPMCQRVMVPVSVQHEPWIPGVGPWLGTMLGRIVVAPQAQEDVQAAPVDPEPPHEEVGAGPASLCVWEQKLLEDFHRIRAANPEITDAAVIGRMQGPYRQCRFAELRGLGNEQIRQHLRRLGVVVSDPLSKHQTGHMGGKKFAENQKAKSLPCKWRNGLTTEQWVVKLWNDFDDPPSARVSRIVQKTTRRRDGIAGTTRQVKNILLAAGIEVEPARREPECTWQERLVKLWEGARERHPLLSDSGRLARVMATCSRSPHPELRAIGGVPILRTLLRELGQAVEDPPSKSECGRLGAPRQVVEEPEPQRREARPIEKCAAPVPLKGYEIEVTLQLVHALTDGGRWRMPHDSERVMRELRSACSFDIGSNPGLASGAAKLTVADVTKFDLRYDDYLTSYAGLPPFRRRDIDLELMREWRRVAA